MRKIEDFEACQEGIIGKKVGSVCVSMYKDASTGLPFFCLEADNEDVLQLSYIIEDTLKLY